MIPILFVAGAILITATACCVCALILASRLDRPSVERITSVQTDGGKAAYTTENDGHEI